jgi:DNA-binding transcriptional LysR family regulator
VTSRPSDNGPRALSPQDLQLLLAIGSTGSFAAAAGSLGLTQSAVSRAVRECEHKAGAVLFDRGRGGARPTAAGEVALAHARQILRQLDRLGVEARSAAGGSLTGTLRIAAFRRAAARLLPPALTRLAARYPALRPQILMVPEVGRGTAGEVADGNADLAIATLAADSGTTLPGLVTRELRSEPFLLAAPSGHPDPRTLPLIDWPENCSSYTRAWWARQQWLPPATIHADDDGVVLSMVAQGLGIAILPELTLADPPAGITVTALGDAPPILKIVSVTTRATAASIAVRELLRELQKKRPLPPRLATQVTASASNSACRCIATCRN